MVALLVLALVVGTAAPSQASAEWRRNTWLAIGAAAVLFGLSQSDDDHYGYRNGGSGYDYYGARPRYEYRNSGWGYDDYGARPRYEYRSYDRFDRDDRNRHSRRRDWDRNGRWR